MTVKELIEVLQTLPPTAMVLLADWSEGYAEPVDLEKSEIELDDNKVILGSPD